MISGITNQSFPLLLEPAVECWRQTTCLSFDNLVVFKDEQKIGWLFKIHCCLWASGAQGADVQLKGALVVVVQPGCPGRVLGGSGGTGVLLCDGRTHAFQSLCLPIFSVLFVCPRSWADSILRRNVYCLLRSMKRKGWDLFVMRKGGTGGGFAAVVSSDNRARLWEEEKTALNWKPRGEQLWGKVPEHS